MGEMFSQDDDLSFWETLGQEPEANPDSGTPAEPVAAEPAAEAEEVVEAVETKAERARDENGRFTKTEPEPETADTPDVQALAAELETLRKRLADKDDFIGRQSNELGEYRKLVEERLAAAERQAQAPRTPVTPDLIDEEPEVALEIALQQGDDAMARLAWDRFQEVDKNGARAWAALKRAEQLEAQAAQKFAELEERFAPLTQSEQDRTLARHVREFEQQHGTVTELVDRAVAKNLPDSVIRTVVKTIESGDIQQTLDGLTTLALLAGSNEDRRQADTLHAARSIAHEQALEAERAIADASVVSATATKVDTPRKTAADLIGDQWDALDAPRIDGWNV